ncbi:hypothetical protein C8R41DRAFT_85239 [Lentinula lateritia]|uniref:Protein kinase domain-containing protein n=1 Tax=Lentinula lateritia TaxID=40482 RepID=A0ABQ8VRV6_9AGAR|nr:hypothetical protein C8R41DRAFT_85239 [Lentinula lateritia]
MIQDDPVKRPTIDEVIMQLDAVVRKHRKSVNFREAACDLQHFEFDDHISALIRRFTKYLLLRRSLPVLSRPQRRLLPELHWMYSGSPTEYPEGQERPTFLYVHDLDNDP